MLSDAARAFKQSPVLALDTETTGLDPRRDELKIISVSDGRSTFIFEPEHWADRELFGRFLRKEIFSKQVVAHNWMFDSQFLHHNFVSAGWPNLVWDTMIAEQMLTSGLLESASLEQSLWRRLGVRIQKDHQKFFLDKAGQAVQLPAEVRRYITDDTQHLLDLSLRQDGLIGMEGLDDVWWTEVETLPVFAKMVYRGIKIDRPKFETLFNEVRAERSRIEAELIQALTPHVMWKRIEKFDAADARLKEYLAHAELAEEFFVGDAQARYPGDERLQKTAVRECMKHWRAEHPRPAKPKLDEDPINLGSAEQVKAAFQDMGIDIESTRKQVLKMKLPDILDDEAARIVGLFLEWRKLEKRIVAFGDPLLAFLDEDDVLHGQIKPYGTRTGRPACEKPNMLQMPKVKEFRDCFIARDGFVIVRFDYAQMELRIACELSGDQAMLKAFRDGLDLHTYTASLMYGVAYAEVTDGQRKIAKIVNFGILYGMGPVTLQATLVAEGIPTTQAEAEQHLERWKASFPEAAAAIERWGEHALRHGWTATVMGRRQRFTVDRTTERGVRRKIARVGANHVVQGSNADITKLAMTMIQPRLEALGGSLLLQIYDELVAEVPEEHAEAGAEIVASCMLAAAKSLLKTVPVGVDGEVSKSWAGIDPLFKKAEVA